MNLGKNLLVALLMLWISSGCESFPPPQTEICITSDNYISACVDKRLPEGEQEYDKEYEVNIICTNPADYDLLYNYCMDLREKLIQCRRD